MSIEKMSRRFTNQISRLTPPEFEAYLRAEARANLDLYERVAGLIDDLPTVEMTTGIISLIVGVARSMGPEVREAQLVLLRKTTELLEDMQRRDPALREEVPS